MPTYLGYSPLKKTIEIISWNDNFKKFDFFISQPLELGKSIKTYSVQEKSCLACHQSGSPIFSRHPWAEVPFLNKPLKKKYKSLKKSNTRLYEIAHQGNPFTFDSLVRDGQKALAAVSLCKKACKEDLICHNELSQWGNFRSEFNSSFLKLKNLFILDNINISQRSSVLPDRDPLIAVNGTTTLHLISDFNDFRESVSFRQFSNTNSKNVNLEQLIQLKRFNSSKDITFREEIALLPLADFTGLEAKLYFGFPTHEGHPLFPRPKLDYGTPEITLKRLRPYFRNCNKN